jgi:hypothetical protein
MIHAMGAIRDASNALARYYVPLPLSFDLRGLCAANAGVFEGLKRAFPADDWRQVYSVEVAGPAGGAHVSHHLRAEAASGQAVWILDGQGRNDLASVLEAWARHLVERADAGPTVEVMRPAETPAIISLGERKYRIGNLPPVVVTDREDAVLQSFLENPSQDGVQLEEKSGYERHVAVRVLRSLITKYGGRFAPAITRARGRGKGGYHVNFRQE